MTVTIKLKIDCNDEQFRFSGRTSVRPGDQEFDRVSVTS